MASSTSCVDISISSGTFTEGKSLAGGLPDYVKIQHSVLKI